MTTAIHAHAPGVITEITAQRKFQSRVNIKIDGQFAFGLHMDLVLAEGLSKGVELSSEKIVRLLQEDSFIKAREKALHYIGYRARSTQEVITRLSREHYTQEAIERVITRLIELDMLDDQKFAQEFAEGRLRNKGFGPMRIQQDLRRKGISPEIIETVVASVFEEMPPEELAAVSAEKIFARLSRQSDTFVRRKKLSDYLLRRGFNYDQMDLAFEKLDQFVTESKA
jgi:regulatory protein